MCLSLPEKQVGVFEDFGDTPKLANSHFQFFHLRRVRSHSEVVYHSKMRGDSTEVSQDLRPVQGDGVSIVDGQRLRPEHRIAVFRQKY